MKSDKLSLEIRASQLDFLVNKLKSSNWGILLMALAFSYFYWDHAPRAILLAWLSANVVITVARTLFVYPRYDRTVITQENVGVWLNWFTFTLAITGLTWGAALPFFFVSDDPLLLLVLMFSFFTLMVSATVTLASHMPGFIAFTLPLVASIAALFVSGGERIYLEFSVAFVLFSIFTAYFYRSTHREITQLITLQLEKQTLVDELEEKKNIADESRLIAKHSVQEKNQFLAAASHDLRQPLHASGLLISMLDGHVRDDKGIEILEDIKMANGALSHSFSSLMDISKLDAGVVEVNHKHFSLTEFVNSLTSEVSQQLSSKNIELTIDIEEITVYSDLQLLTRVVRNILSNAIKFTHQGTIEILGKRTGESGLFSLSIRDTGIGIPASEKKLIFSEYYQLDNPERGRDKGFGLGLAIVKRLCRLLKIDIQLESELGTGTVLTLLVPEGNAAKITKPEAKESLFSPLDRMKILVLDDDPYVLKTMKRLLESWGCSAITAPTRAEAIDIINSEKISLDLIIADYRLNDDDNGVDVCFEIFNIIGRKIDAVIITGDTSPARLQEVKKSNFPILHKPVPPGELRSYLQRISLR